MLWNSSRVRQLDFDSLLGRCGSTPIYVNVQKPLSRARQGLELRDLRLELSMTCRHLRYIDILGFMGSCSDPQFFDLQPSVDFDRTDAHDASLEGCGPSRFLITMGVVNGSWAKDEYDEYAFNATPRSREPCTLDLTLLLFRSHSRPQPNRQKLGISPTLPILGAGRAHSHKLAAPMIALGGLTARGGCLRDARGAIGHGFMKTQAIEDVSGMHSCSWPTIFPDGSSQGQPYVTCAPAFWFSRKRFRDPEKP
ncbi:hypothetical protein BS47DRAFT_1399750 [Hydnum rufescens UP504]|uniref:Uncharacterized protein n=1 Tax=Hydnum rufescens UP504 TaxID=1448309 RepID=A0A9P6DKG2_9AGAM|nr:hypothetical protein BS47DRAFT_1399750 [Hydnum rufescens UP504]